MFEGPNTRVKEVRVGAWALLARGGFRESDFVALALIAGLETPSWKAGGPYLCAIFNELQAT